MNQLRILKNLRSKKYLFCAKNSFATESKQRIFIPDPPESRTQKVSRNVIIGASLVFLFWLLKQFTSPDAIKTIRESHRLSEEEENSREQS